MRLTKLGYSFDAISLLSYSIYSLNFWYILMLSQCIEMQKIRGLLELARVKSEF